LLEFASLELLRPLQKIKSQYENAGNGSLLGRKVLTIMEGIQRVGSRCLHSFSAETFQMAARVTAMPMAATAVLDFQVLGRAHHPPEGDLQNEKMPSFR
jgi:hypothetical protein